MCQTAINEKECRRQTTDNRRQNGRKFNRETKGNVGLENTYVENPNVEFLTVL